MMFVTSNATTISVIICSHNPRIDYLQRVLEALKAQTLSRSEWELLLIDNACSQPLADRIDLSWHPCARCVRENNLGLTPARLRGISETRGDVLVFVDDDNVLASDYLSQALAIAQSWPMIGAWGGHLCPEFETPPDEWTKPYLPLIGAGASSKEDKWSNQYDGSTTPCGAGLCIRRCVANQYANYVRTSTERLQLGRTGKVLLSGEDTDMALTACDMGMGTAFFAALQIVHLIPARRLRREYLIRLRESMTYSQVILSSFRPNLFRSKKPLRLVADYLRAFLAPAPERSFRLASLRGELKARRVVAARTDNKFR